MIAIFSDRSNIEQGLVEDDPEYPSAERDDALTSVAGLHRGIVLIYRNFLAVVKNRRPGTHDELTHTRRRPFLVLLLLLLPRCLTLESEDGI
jgi:hypothetical protein